MKAFLKNNLLVLIPFLLLISAACWFIVSFPKEQVHMYFNSYVGNRYYDLFFYYITYVGDGTLAAFILLVIMLFNVRKGLYCTISFLTATSICNILKYTLFDDVNRPYFHFQYLTHAKLQMVEGLDLHIHNSFPSGHATQAFAILLPLAFTTKKQWVKVLCLFLAVLTSLSRVYLSQHWLNDITAGSIIGMACALLYSKFVNQNPRLLAVDMSLRRLLGKRKTA